MTATYVSPVAPGTRAGPDGPIRLLIAAAPDLVTHRSRNGPLPWLGGPGYLLPIVEASGLSGRGGAGFPTWRKLAAVASGDRPVVIANGAEGEPASAKDRALLTTAPHLVLDGLQLAAEAVGAGFAYAYVPAVLAGGVRHALAERARGGWDRVRVEVVEAPDEFVAGEESAVVARIEGRPALPRDTPRLVVSAGVRGRPTLVQNVETLAHLAMIARHGAAWFREQGTGAEPGTFLATVSGAVTAPGVYEMPYGAALTELLARAGGPAAPMQALLVGGYHGTWLPGPLASAALMSRAALAPLGASPGAGVVVVLPAGVCGLAVSARIASYLAAQTAGQCGPCVNGLPRMADTLARLGRMERRPELAAQVERLARLVEGRGACHHPDGTSRFVRSSLLTFADEVQAHLDGRCQAPARNRVHR
jgi:NADH:ubiquinone oxidoreductase subunit F (NADH-binding)